MTIEMLFALLLDLRVRLLEDRMRPGRLFVQVPRDSIWIVRHVLEHERPVNVLFVYEPLAWWRCRFVRQQAVRL